MTSNLKQQLSLIDLFHLDDQQMSHLTREKTVETMKSIYRQPSDTKDQNYRHKSRFQTDSLQGSIPGHSHKKDKDCSQQVISLEVTNSSDCGELDRQEHSNIFNSEVKKIKGSDQSTGNKVNSSQKEEEGVIAEVQRSKNIDKQNVSDADELSGAAFNVCKFQALDEKKDFSHETGDRKSDELNSDLEQTIFEGKEDFHTTDLLAHSNIQNGNDVELTSLKAYPSTETKHLVDMELTSVQADPSTEIKDPDDIELTSMQAYPSTEMELSDLRDSENEDSEMSKEMKGDQKRKTITKEPFCDICGKTFARQKYLSKHRRVHSGEKPFSCDLCGKSFAQSGNLSRHMKVHSNDKPHRCDICHVQFSHACSLTQHMLIHTGKKPYKCDICDKQFTQSGNLSQHRLIHSGEKPHKCDICDKQFAHSGNLARHKLVHTGEMPHKCAECGKQFTHPFSLSQHKLIWHTGEKPYKCDVCNAQFTNSGNLRQHKYIHTGEKPHHCDMCGEQFTNPGSLVRHKEIEHKVFKDKKNDLLDAGNFQSQVETGSKTLVPGDENQVIDSYIQNSLQFYLMNGTFK